MHEKDVIVKSVDHDQRRGHGQRRSAMMYGQGTGRPWLTESWLWYLEAVHESGVADGDMIDRAWSWPLCSRGCGQGFVIDIIKEDVADKACALTKILFCIDVERHN